MSDSAAPERRRQRRFPVTGRSLIFSGDGRPVKAELVNVSQLGIRFRKPIAFEAGSTVSISMIWGGTKKAKVVWQDGSVCGCEFAEVLRHQDVTTAFAPSLAVCPDARLRPAVPAAAALASLGLLVMVGLLIH